MERKRQVNLPPLITLNQEAKKRFADTGIVDTNGAVWFNLYQASHYYPFTTLLQGTDQFAYICIPDRGGFSGVIRSHLDELHASRVDLEPSQHGNTEEVRALEASGFRPNKGLWTTYKYQLQVLDITDQRTRTATAAKNLARSLDSLNTLSFLVRDFNWVPINVAEDYGVKTKEGQPDCGILKLPGGPSLIFPLSSGEVWYMSYREGTDTFLVQSAGTNQRWEVTRDTGKGETVINLITHPDDTLINWGSRTCFSYRRVRKGGSDVVRNAERIQFPPNKWQIGDVQHMMVAFPGIQEEMPTLLDPLYHIHNPVYSFDLLQAIAQRNPASTHSAWNNRSIYQRLHIGDGDHIDQRDTERLMERLRISIDNWQLPGDEKILAQEAFIRMQAAFQRVGLLPTIL